MRPRFNATEDRLLFQLAQAAGYLPEDEPYDLFRSVNDPGRILRELKEKRPEGDVLALLAKVQASLARESQDEGAASSKGKASTRRRHQPRRLSHTRALQCFDRSVANLAHACRNTLTRRARLLRIAKALGLGSEVNREEIAQRVLQAKDLHYGRSFRALSAADRLAMEAPRLDWLLPGLLPANDMTILGGRAKVGKTRLAVAMAAAFLTGSEVLGATPETLRPVVLITDDQADHDTATQLQALGLWSHERLHWSRSFRLTEHDLDRLLESVKENPGAVVVMDSLRSIGRSLRYGENDPEIGSMLYDLKQAVIDAGGSLLLIHHCNKAEGLIGTEALSGHNAIAGAANTILTMHHLPGPKGQPMKGEDTPRRLVREARSGPGFDLVIDSQGGRYRRVCTFADWQQQQKAAAAEGEGPNSEKQSQVLETIGELSDPKGSTVREIAEVIYGPDPTKPQTVGARKQCDSLVIQGFLRRVPDSQPTRYRVRGAEEG